MPCKESAAQLRGRAARPCPPHRRPGPAPLPPHPPPCGRGIPGSLAFRRPPPGALSHGTLRSFRPSGRGGSPLTAGLLGPTRGDSRQPPSQARPQEEPSARAARCRRRPAGVTATVRATSQRGGSGRAGSSPPPGRGGVRPADRPRGAPAVCSALGGVRARRRGDAGAQRP